MANSAESGLFLKQNASRTSSINHGKYKTHSLQSSQKFIKMKLQKRQNESLMNIKSVSSTLEVPEKPRDDFVLRRP